MSRMVKEGAIQRATIYVNDRVIAVTVKTNDKMLSENLKRISKLKMSPLRFSLTMINTVAARTVLKVTETSLDPVQSLQTFVCFIMLYYLDQFY